MAIHVRFVPIKRSHTVPPPSIWNSFAATNFSILQDQLPERHSSEPIKHLGNFDCILLYEEFLSIREDALGILLHGDERLAVTVLLGPRKCILKKNITLKQKYFTFSLIVS